MFEFIASPTAQWAIGILASSALSAVGLFRRRTRRRIKMRVRTGIVVGASTHSALPTFLELEVANLGTDQVTIMNWGYLLPNRNNLFQIGRAHPLSTAVPTALRKNEAVSFFLDRDNSVEKLKEAGFRIEDCKPWIEVAGGRRILGRKIRFK